MRLSIFKVIFLEIFILCSKIICFFENHNRRNPNLQIIIPICPCQTYENTKDSWMLSAPNYEVLL